MKTRIESGSNSNKVGFLKTLGLLSPFLLASLSCNPPAEPQDPLKGKPDSGVVDLNKMNEMQKDRLRDLLAKLNTMPISAEKMHALHTMLLPETVTEFQVGGVYNGTYLEGGLNANINTGEGFTNREENSININVPGDGLKIDLKDYVDKNNADNTSRKFTINYIYKSESGIDQKISVNQDGSIGHNSEQGGWDEYSGWIDNGVVPLTLEQTNQVQAKAINRLEQLISFIQGE